jgi:hypothetical protein
MISYRFGKHPAKNDYRTLRFSKYLIKKKLQPPPASYDVLQNVYKELGISDPKVLFPMDDNSRYGDCTIAALAHATTVYSGLIGKNNVMAQQDVLNLYLSLTHGIDSGLNELDVLNYWRNNVVSGDEIIAYVKIDEKNHTHIQLAIQIFGGVYLGFQVQEGCIDEFNNGQPWTPGPLTQDGHAVFAVSYDPTYVTVLTWGNIQKGTWDWWDECVDEAYAILPQQAQNSEFAPGFDFDQLKADLSAVAN